MTGTSTYISNLRSKFLMSGALIAFTMAFAASPAYANCNEDMSGETLICDGDLSDIPFISSDTVSEIIFTGVTEDIGARGFRFLNNEAVDVTFDTSAEPINIVLDPPATNVANQRTGFHIITDGAITGNFTGNLSGVIEQSQTSNDDNLAFANFGALGLEAGSDIDLTLNGNIDVERGAIRQTGNSRQDVFSNRFAALRAESDAGDITITSTGDIAIDGGERIVETINSTEGTAGARAIQFTNEVSEAHGVFAQGFGDFEFSHMGDISVTGGGADVTATTQNNTADAQAGHSEISGIFIPAFNSVNGEFVDDLPRFENVNIDFTGDITIEGGDVFVTAISTSTGANEAEGAAVAIGNDFQTGGVATGLNVAADNIDIDFTGNLNVTGGDITASARASEGGSGERSGLVHLDADAQDGTGIVVNSGEGGQASLVVDGPVTVRGGNVTADIEGVGSAPTGTLYADVNDVNETASYLVRGGSAIGINYVNGGETDLQIRDIIDVRGGDANVSVSGRNNSGIANGGGSLGLSVFGFGESDVNYIHETDIISRGGDLTYTNTGVEMAGNASGGNSNGISFAAGTTANFTHNAVIDAIGGEASFNVTQTNEDLEFSGGNAQAVNISLIGDETRSTINLNGIYNATGGDAFGTGDVGAALGGSATGVFSLTGNGESPTVNLNGTINAVAGNGTEARGSAIGAFLLDSQTLNILGTVNVEGGNDVPDTTFGQEGNVRGVVAVDESRRFGDTPGLIINVDGGQINSTGQNVTGIEAAGDLVEINIVNNGQVNALGNNTQGIVINGIASFGDETALLSTSSIFIEDGSSLISDDGVGIIDQSEFTRRIFSTADGLVETLFETPNQTNVDIAGIVTGGNGVAIDLGTGSDSFIGRSTGVINGDVLLGEGDDTITTEDGVTINGVLDAGAGADVADLAEGTIADFITLGTGDDILILPELSNTLMISGGDGNDTGLFTTSDNQDSSFDLGNFALTEFETFAQEGTGTLTVTNNSSNVFSRYELRGGSANILTDLSGVDVVTSANTNLFLGGAVGGLDISGDVSTLGDPTGQVNVAGDIIFRQGSVFNARFLPDGTSDAITADGTITIEGGQVNALSGAGQFIGGDQFVILSGAGGITGTFDGLTQASTAFLDITLETIGNDVVIQLAPSADFVSVAETTNQLGAATGLLDFGTLQGTDERVVVSELSFLLEGEALPALDAVSGELHATVLKTGLEQARLLPNAMRKRANSIQQSGWSGWIAADGLTGDFDEDGNAAETDFSRGSVVGGVDWTSASKEVTFGAAIGRSNETLRLDDRASRATRQATHFGAHGRYGKAETGLLATGSLAISQGSTDTTRNIVFGNLDRTATATYDLDLFNAEAELRYGYPTQSKGLHYGPAVRVEYVSADQGAINEIGADSLNLSGESESENQTRLGLGGYSTWQSDNLKIDLSALYDITGNRDISRNLSLSGASGTDFIVFAPDAGSGGVILDGGATWLMSDRISLGLGYEGRFNGEQNSHAALLSLSIR